MGNYADLYATLRDNAVRDFGKGADGRTGAALPKMFAHDPFLYLALLYDDTVRALEHAADAKGAVHFAAWAVNVPAGNIAEVVNGPEATPDVAIPVGAWLTRGRAAGDNPTIRYVKLPLFPLLSGIDYQLGTARTAGPVTHVTERWDRCVKLAANHLAAMTTVPRLSPSSISEWWSSLYQLMISIESVLEEPNPSASARIKGGIKAAASSTVTFLEDTSAEAAELAGKAAAHVATTAGKAAGAAASGFFSEAGMTAYLAVGVALVIALS